MLMMPLKSVVFRPYLSSRLSPTFGDDSNRLGDSFGSDGMISSNHDDLDAGAPALGDRVRHGSSGRINHGHEAHELKSVQREVGVVAVEFETNGEFVSGQSHVAEA